MVLILLVSLFVTLAVFGFVWNNMARAFHTGDRLDPEVCGALFILGLTAAVVTFGLHRSASPVPRPNPQKPINAL